MAKKFHMNSCELLVFQFPWDLFRKLVKMAGSLMSSVSALASTDLDLLFRTYSNKDSSDSNLGGGNSNIFYFQPCLGKIHFDDHIFQMG